MAEALQDHSCKGLACKFVQTWAVLALVAFALDVFEDHLIVPHFMRRAALSVFLPFDAKAYQAPDPRLLVLDIDQQSLSADKLNWPLPYRVYTRILRRVGQYEPRLVFMDIAFAEARHDEGLEGMVAALCDLHDSGTTVLLASPLDRPLRPELEALAGGGQRTCFRKVGVEFHRDDLDGRVWSYPLQAQSSTGRIPSAAVLISEALDRTPITLPQTGEIPDMGLTWSTSADLHGGPRWRFGGNEANNDEVQHFCRPQGALLLDMFGGVRELLHLGDIDNRLPCPAHPTLPLDQLLAARSVDEQDALRAALHQKAVLVGTSSGTDVLSSPLHGIIPGVYLHAQAADNLLRHQAGMVTPLLARQYPLLEFPANPLGWSVKFGCVLLASMVPALYLALRDRLLAGGQAVLGWLRLTGPTRWSWLQGSMALSPRLRHPARRTPPQGAQASEAHAGVAPTLALNARATLQIALGKIARRVLVALGKILITMVLLLPTLLVARVIEQWVGVSVYGFAPMLGFLLFAEFMEMSPEPEHPHHVSDTQAV